jgi:uroporphyrinogen-III decarboxylase
MDPEDLKREFGDNMVFWGGGVDTQKTLPFGTPGEVKDQVKDYMRIFGKGGGFIFAAVHNIQAMIPTENLLAMFDTLRDSGRYPLPKN